MKKWLVFVAVVVAVVVVMMIISANSLADGRAAIDQADAFIEMVEAGR